MKARRLRVILPAAVFAAVGVGFAVSADVGTLSAFGWGDISALCPLGALATMIAERSAVPRAVASLVLFVALTVAVGRAFCAWICPVPLVSRLRGALGGREPLGAKRGRGAASAIPGEGAAADGAFAPLTEDEKALISSCRGGRAETRRGLDSRHLVLGGSILSAAVFGFPVFCLVCPIGLTFATVFLLVRAFGFGDASWGLVAVPALLLLEVVVFRRWCHALCPLGALMSLVARANRTLRPQADAPSCIESSGGTCARCAAACPEGIDPHDPARGTGLNECTRCMECVDACPTKAMSIALLPKHRRADEAAEGGESR